ncbi:hypothetical protein F1721_01240 [Saccharopolyspora hirsuta]|uniref:Uncharacterized protein n=1 Tax=Saccharopolyspora hirsuta TaxID=1837 RepID=A0A5M7C8Q3_SACHI|nr:hypothetical protein [Saccharopolyspora hirsuta]KAA5838113.1 hypothetical protein F1721_01240 [Saccharopolyspora hirsuta]
MLHEGEVVPSVAVLSHHEQRDRLARYCPEAVPIALVAGDPCFDRMLASRPLRDSYRHRLGIGPDQRCIAISSTWGRASLFGQHPSLVLRLARQLPLDEYRVVVALHPNIWHGHSPWQVRMWLAECARAGVVVLPPEEGWRAGLVAADLTIGDHGSVTFYSAALGTPVLLATWPEETVDPASPIAALLRTAPRLDPHAPLAEQVDAAIDAHRPADFAHITDLATSEPGRSAALLRAEIYTRMELEEPPVPADSAAVPLPTAEPAGAGSQLIVVQLADRTASVTRFPAAALDEPAISGGVLVACADEPDRRWLELAEVLVHDDRYDDPLRWIRSSLSRLPGCMLAATRDRAGCWIISGTDLPAVRFRGADDLGPVCAAVLHAWLCSGRSPRELPERLRIGLGPREELLHLSTQD